MIVIIGCVLLAFLMGLLLLEPWSVRRWMKKQEQEAYRRRRLMHIQRDVDDEWPGDVSPGRRV